MSFDISLVMIKEALKQQMKVQISLSSHKVLIELLQEKNKNMQCENKASDCEADQHLCFCYKDSTIPLLLKFEISSF